MFRKKDSFKSQSRDDLQNVGLKAVSQPYQIQKEIEEFKQTEYSSCFWCQGYYGPNYGQPVCITCHLFLFTKDINIPEEEVYIIEKTDSGDSGTEEPDNEDDFYDVPPAGDPPGAVGPPLPPIVPPPAENVAAEVKVRGQQGGLQGAVGPPVEAPPVNVSPAASGVCASSICCMSTKDRLMERIAALSTPRDYEAEKLSDGMVDSLPPEVLLVVFSYLDDIALWTVGRVCTRWKQIVEDVVGAQSTWQRYVGRRWPLFNPQYNVACWNTIYTKLLQSAPCRYCLESMMLKSTPPIEENSWRRRRLRSELKALRSDPPEGIQATPLDRHCCHWQASITGPHGSPYEGGLFFLYLQIPHSYPMRPPVVRFMTRVFHPNISRHGDVGLDSIQHNWSLALTISKVLISIQSLLTDPFCRICMEPAVGRLYEKDPHGDFARIARLWTWRYAMHDYLLSNATV